MRTRRREEGSGEASLSGRAPKLFRRCGKVKQVRGTPVGRGFSADRTGRVDAFRGVVLSFQARLQTWSSMDRAESNEADVQAPQSQAGQQARIPRADEDQGGAQDAQPSSSSRSGQADREGRREVDAESRARGERFPRDARVTRSADIEALLRRGERRRTKNLDVFYAASPASRSRFGTIVPKHGKKVVDRNLVKRRLREIARRELLPKLDAVSADIDVLVRARRSAYDAGFEDLRRELAEALETTWSRSS